MGDIFLMTGPISVGPHVHSSYLWLWDGLLVQAEKGGQGRDLNAVAVKRRNVEPQRVEIQDMQSPWSFDV